MNFIDERLARLKYATRMAVTRQDTAPAAWSATLAGAPLALTAPPAPAGAAPRVRRVSARLIALPAQPAAPEAGEMTSWRPAPAAPGVAAMAAPLPQTWADERAQPGPAALPVVARPGDLPAGDPLAGRRGPPSPDSAAPHWTAETPPEAPSADPYGDHAALLAAGLRDTPPAALPPLPAVTDPAPRPLRAASFMETLALNTLPPADRAAPAAPQAAQATPPAAPVPSLPVEVTRPTLPPATPVAPPPLPGADLPGSGRDRPSPAVIVADSSRPDSAPAPLPSAPAARAPLAPSSLAPASMAPAPAPAAPESAAFTGQPAPTARQPQATAGEVAPVSAWPAPDQPAPDQPAPRAAAPDGPAPSQDLPVPAAPDSTQASPRSGPATPAGPPAAEPVTQPGTPTAPAVPGPVPVDDEQARRETQDRERKELEALLRSGNSDIPVRLPRRPRPVPMRAPAPPEPEEVKVAPPIPAEVSQNILARLNRFAELEEAGETDASVIPFGQLENWKDHHPERNVSAAGDPPAAAPASATAAPPRLDVPPSGVRVKARSRGQGREPQAARHAPADADEEPERGRPASAIWPTGGDQADAAPGPPPAADGRPERTWHPAPAAPTPWPPASPSGSVVEPEPVTTPRPAVQGADPDRPPDTPQSVASTAGRSGTSSRPGRALAPEVPPPRQAPDPAERQPPGVPVDVPRPERVTSPPAPAAPPAATAPVAEASPALEAAQVPGVMPPVRRAVPTQPPGEPRPPARSPEAATQPTTQLPVPGLNPGEAGRSGSLPAVDPPSPVQTAIASEAPVIPAGAHPRPVGPGEVPFPVALPPLQSRPAALSPAAPWVPAAVSPAAVPSPVRPAPPARTVLRPPHPAASTTPVPPADDASPAGTSTRPVRVPARAARPGDALQRSSAPPSPRDPFIATPPVSSGDRSAVAPPALPTPGLAPSPAAYQPTPHPDAPSAPASVSPVLPAPPAAEFLGYSGVPTAQPVAATGPTWPVPVERVDPRGAPPLPAPVQQQPSLPDGTSSAAQGGADLPARPVANAAPARPLGIQPHRPAAQAPHAPAVPANWNRAESPVMPAPRSSRSTGDRAARPTPTTSPGRPGEDRVPSPPILNDLPPVPTFPTAPDITQRQWTGAARVPSRLPLPEQEPARATGPRWTAPPVTLPDPAPPQAGEPTMPPGLPVGASPVPAGAAFAPGTVPLPDAAPGPAQHSPDFPPQARLRPADGAARPSRPPQLTTALIPPRPTAVPGPAPRVPRLGAVPADPPGVRHPASAAQQPTPTPLADTPLPVWPARPPGVWSPLQPSPSVLTAPATGLPALPLQIQATPGAPAWTEAPTAAAPGAPVAAMDASLPVWSPRPTPPEFRSPGRAGGAGPQAQSGRPPARPNAAAPGLSVPAPGFSPPALPDPLTAAPDVIPPPADLPWARPGAPRAAQEGAAQERAARLSPSASGAAIQRRPGVLPSAPAVPPGPPALRHLPRAARAPEQPVLKALEHALERDGHGTPFSPGEQDALRDVLGTSVADVRVVRRPEVAAALRAARADGLTVGETVFLPHDLPLGSAAGLALAAHEVTHARRAREPLFVPAALTRPDRRSAAPTASDEEGVALATEHAVSDQAGPVGGPARGPAGNGRATAGRGADAPRRLPGLPAPWEPLPGWETAGPEAPGAAHERAPAASPVRTPAPLPVAAPPLPAAPAPLWHAAASDRAPATAATPARPPEDQAVGRRAQPRSSVDLDQVAREVYARLRERLSQELRRLH